MNVVALFGLFFAGMLAGIEFIVRYGVHPALAALPDQAHLLARHEVVRIVRVIVPIVMLPSIILSVVVLATGGGGAGLPFRWAAVATYAIYFAIVIVGTVPINSRFFDWDKSAPPADWKSFIDRWALIDVFRSSAAIVAFALLLVAAAAG